MRTLMVVLLPMLALACGRSADPVWRGEVVQSQLDIPGEARHAPSLTVGTYNLHGLKNADELRAELRDYPAAVWALQELKCDGSMRTILPPGRWWVAILPLNLEHGEWESQAIVSRFPIKSVERWNLPATGSKRRAALAAIISTDAGDVCFANTDHQLSYLDPANGKNLQVNELSRRLKELSIDRVIVAGDFNTTGNVFRFRSGEKDVVALNSAMEECNLMPLPHRAPGDSTFRAAGARLQLDHIYFRGLRCVGWMTMPSGGSDHRAVLAQFTSP